MFYDENDRKPFFLLPNYLEFGNKLFVDDILGWIQRLGIF